MLESNHPRTGKRRRYCQRGQYQCHIPDFLVANLPSLAKHPSALATAIYLAHKADVSGEARVDYSELKAILGTQANSVPARALKRLVDLKMIEKCQRGRYMLLYEICDREGLAESDDWKKRKAQLTEPVAYGEKVSFGNRHQAPRDPSLECKARDSDLGGIVWWARTLEERYPTRIALMIEAEVGKYTRRRITSDVLLGRIALILAREGLVDLDGKYV